MNATSYSPDGDRPKKVPLQVDLYGLKAEVTPQPSADPPPKTWRQVGVRVNYALMRLCLGVPELAASVVTGLDAIVRGVASLPAAISSRVRRAHDRVDHVLEAGPAQPKAVAVAVAEPSDPAEELLALIDDYRDAGIEVVQVRLETGQWAFALVEPEAAGAAIDCAAKAIEGRVLELDAPRPKFIVHKSRTPLDQCDLPKKAVAALKAAGYDFLEVVASAKAEAVAAVRGIGPAYMESIRDALAERRMRWRE